MGALEPGAEVGLGSDRVPHLRRRLILQIRQAAVARLRRPGGQGLELRRPLVLEQRALGVARLLQARETDVVPPALQERERRRMVARAERAGEDRQVLADELLLQIDGVGGDDGALAVLACPAERGREVREGLPHARARFQQRDATVVVGVRDIRRHVALARPVLEGPERAGHRTLRGEQPRDIERIGPRGRARARAFDHDVAVRDRVVHDGEAHSPVVQPGGHAQVGTRGLEHAARVVVQQQLPSLGDPRQREHRVHRAARHRARLHEDAVRIGARHERHLAPVRRGDLRAHQLTDRRRQALDAHVLSSRFFAAGNSTLLRMRRYPGECGCSDRSVGGSPIWCCWSSGS